jgi:hypothetical protein
LMLTEPKNKKQNPRYPSLSCLFFFCTYALGNVGSFAEIVLLLALCRKVKT